MAAMKYALVICGLLAGAGQARGQGGTEGVAAPFKGASALLIRTSDSARVAYQKLAQSLLAGGYGLEKTDKELGYISTSLRPAPRYNMLYACKFFVKPTATGADIQVSGVFTLPGAAAVSAAMAGESQIEYRGGPASTFMVCWQAMQKALLSAYPEAAPLYLAPL